MDKILFLLTVFCAFLPLIAIFAMTPYIAKKGTCFGVMLIEDAQRSDKIKKIKRDYSVLSVATGVIFAVAACIFSTYNILAAALICYCGASLALYLMCSFAVRNMVMTEGWEKLQKEVNVKYVPTQDGKGVISLWWNLLYIPVIGLTWYLSLGKEIEYGMLLPLAQIAAAPLIFVLQVIFKNSGQYAEKRNIEASVAENAEIRRRWSVFVFFAGLAAIMLMTLLQLGTLEIITNKLLIMAAPFIVTVGICGFAIYVAFKNNK